ncbi:hypothetical protein EVAR_48028_1 [Eumeta japonica]|uniref:Uncharacterized protein n=1 Tax=Eumeta variegata TaxID=151549 RepID=A0A4C2AE95_EUMVA|nr:hypothetical protein EVAR_48028_1 [Eumeta japonica]
MPRRARQSSAPDVVTTLVTTVISSPLTRMGPHVGGLRFKTLYLKQIMGGTPKPWESSNGGDKNPLTNRTDFEDLKLQLIEEGDYRLSSRDKISSGE